MKKLFVSSYELSLALKELGFYEECFGCYYQAIEYVDRDYHKREDKVYNEGSPIYFTTGKYYKDVKYTKFLVGVPTWEQAFNWFREKYNLDSYVRQTTYREWKFEINYIIQNDSEEEWEKYKKFLDFKDTQEDAREACLEKLIELVKTFYL